MISRDDILAAIRQTADENGGTPVGRRQFSRLTGVSDYEIVRYWPRYGDAVREAGFEPNLLNAARDDGDVLERFLDLTRHLGHVPTLAELRLARAADATFPSPGVFQRLGSRDERIVRAIEHCKGDAGSADVLPILEAARVSTGSAEALPTDRSGPPAPGFVYLARGHRGEFKIGRTNLVDRRLAELGVSAAVEPILVHEIKTDDAVGVEAYWHRRFADKKMRGEWFRLSAADVAAFRRWRRIF